MIYTSLKNNIYYDSNLDVLDYKIVENGNVIYFGHSVKSPKTNVNRINIGEIIRDYLENNMIANWPEMGSGYTGFEQENAYKQFSLINGEIILETYGVLCSYCSDFDGTDVDITYPINGKLDSRMKFFYTRYSQYDDPIPVEDNKNYFTLVALQEGYIKHYGIANYRINKTVWVEQDEAGPEQNIYVEEGDIVQWYSTTGRFDSTIDYVASGNAMSLIWGKDFEDKTKITDTPWLSVTKGVLEGLFSGSTTLVSAEDMLLPAEVLDDRCYAYMFAGCTNLSKGPKVLPGKAKDYYITGPGMYCFNVYEGMYMDCQSLTEAPQILNNEITNYCYKYMFKGCTSLQQPPLLIASSLTPECYYGMFSGCTSLLNMPKLITTDYHIRSGLNQTKEYADSCYQSMFEGCTSLVSGTSITFSSRIPMYACYKMFRGCTSLEIAPDIYCSDPVTTAFGAYVFSYMFENCVSLRYIKNTARRRAYDDWSNSDFSGWVNNVSANGTFVKRSGSVWERGSSGIPNNWTVQEV